MYYVIILTVKKRLVNAIKLQDVLSKHGNIIKTRLGLHETQKESHEGLIMLHVSATKKAETLAKSMNKIDGINAKLVKIE